MKSFLNFFNEEYMAIENIYYLDRTLFRKIIAEDAQVTPSDQEIKSAQQDLRNGQATGKYLSQDKQVELILQYQKDRNSQRGVEILKQLVQNKLNYVHAICHHMENQEIFDRSDYNDAVQIGCLALLNAIETFDVEKAPAGFTPWAKNLIVNAIRNEFNPQRYQDAARRYKTSMDSLDQTISGERGEWADKDQTLADKIYDPNTYSMPDEELNKKDEEQLFNAFLETLTDVQQKAIRMYFGVGDQQKKTFEQIGKELGMTKMGALKLVNRARGKLIQLANQEFGKNN